MRIMIATLTLTIVLVDIGPPLLLVAANKHSEK